MTHLRAIYLTVLVDNIAHRDDLKAEHGFSCLIEADSRRILFDTGAKDALVNNSQRLGVSLSDLDALVFSHGHYDHTGGLAAAGPSLGTKRVVAHPNVLGQHHSRRTGKDRDIGIPEAAREALTKLNCKFERKPVEVVDGVWTTGEIPRLALDNHDPVLFADSNGVERDLLLDDMALVLRHQAGLVVVLGCAHAGVANTVVCAEGLFPGEPILAIVGGMHLDGALPAAINAVTQSLQHRSSVLVAPGHCTGTAATHGLLDVLGSRCRPIHVGMWLNFDIKGHVDVLDCTSG